MNIVEVQPQESNNQ